MRKFLFFIGVCFLMNSFSFLCNAADRFDLGPGLNENEYYSTNPPRLIRLNSSSPQMVALKEKIEQILSNDSEDSDFSCSKLNEKLRRVRNEFESAINEINQKLYPRGSMNGGSTYSLREIRKTSEIGVCGLVFYNTLNTKNEIVLAEYDYEGNELEVIKYLQGKL